MQHLPSHRGDGIPRTYDPSLLTPAEKIILAAYSEVSELAPDIRRSEAGYLLLEALQLITDSLEIPLEHLKSAALREPIYPGDGNG